MRGERWRKAMKRTVQFRAPQLITKQYGKYS